jgi:hypothetical protein
MLLALLTSLALSAARPDTVIMVASRSIDLTGDGAAEQLQLVGFGPSVAELELTLTILSGDRLLYTEEIRPFASDGPKPVLTATEYEARLKRFGDGFFADGKFQSPDVFEGSLGLMSARIPGMIALDLRRPVVPDPSGTPREMMFDTTGVGAIWRAMRDRKVVVFDFQSGGDAVTYIAWNEADQRFYKVFQCC